MKLLRFTTALVPLLLCACSATNPRPSREEPHELDYLNYRDDHGNLLGCSWYCGAPPIRVSATSTFRDGIYSYSPANAHDSKKNTVWVEGTEGVGIGERLIFAFDMTDRERYPADDDYEVGINSVSIINGFTRSDKLWKTNARVKTLKVIFDGKVRGTIGLEDTMEPRWIDLPKLVFSPGRVNEVAFEIVEVYPGSEHEDTALADFFFSGFGVH
jgi:hypothetical protein